MNGQILGRTEYAYTLFQHPKQIAWMWQRRRLDARARSRENFDKTLGQHLQHGRHGDAEVDGEVSVVTVRWPLGVVDVSTRAAATSPARADAARADGFAHIDPLLGTDPASLALPIGCPTAFPKPVDPGGAPRRRRPRELDGTWERAVRWWRAAPQRVARAVGGRGRELDRDGARVPRRGAASVRLLVDTGHVADWGGDPCELLDLADHVQLRQGKPGHTQLHVDDPDGRRRLRAPCSPASTGSTTAGKLSVEYFDLPENGWPLDDPEQWARDLAAHLRGSRDLDAASLA